MTRRAIVLGDASHLSEHLDDQGDVGASTHHAFIGQKEDVWITRRPPSAIGRAKPRWKLPRYWMHFSRSGGSGPADAPAWDAGASLPSA